METFEKLSLPWKKSGIMVEPRNFLCGIFNIRLYCAPFFIISKNYWSRSHAFHLFHHGLLYKLKPV